MRGNWIDSRLARLTTFAVWIPKKITILHFVRACLAFLSEGSLDIVVLTEGSVIVSRVTLVATHFLHGNSGELLGQRDAIPQSRAFIEGVERHFLNE